MPDHRAHACHGLTFEQHKPRRSRSELCKAQSAHDLAALSHTQSMKARSTMYAGKGKEDTNIEEEGLANPNGRGNDDLQGPSEEVGGLLSSCQISL